MTRHYYAALRTLSGVKDKSLWVGVDFLTWTHYFETEEEAQAKADELNEVCNGRWMREHRSLLPDSHPHFEVGFLPF